MEDIEQYERENGKVKGEELRYCFYCKKDTPTKEEDCCVCGLSKPYKKT
jgi:hypothetical protein